MSNIDFRCTILSLRLLIVSALLVVGWLSAADTPGSTQNRHSIESEYRQLRFPDDECLGALYVVSADNVYGYVQARAVSARGAVNLRVPPGYLVAFEPNGRVCTHPERMAKVSATQIDILRIKMIEMEGNNSVTDLVLKYVGAFKNLVSLDLAQSDVTDDGLLYVKNLQKLKYLTVFRTMVKGRSLSVLSTLPALIKIDVSCGGLEEATLRYLALAPKLERLELKGSNLTRSGMDYVAKCRHLLRLSIADNRKIGDDCIVDLLALKEIEDLDLHGTSITMKGLRSLKSVSTLRRLMLPKPVYTTAELTELQAILPKCKVVQVQKGVTAEQRVMFAPVR